MSGEYRYFFWRLVRFFLDMVGVLWRYGGVSVWELVLRVNINMSLFFLLVKVIFKVFFKLLKSKISWLREIILFFGNYRVKV